MVEIILTEEGADEGVPKEQGIKSMSLKKDWDYFLEDDLFGLKQSSDLAHCCEKFIS